MRKFQIGIRKRRIIKAGVCLIIIIIVSVNILPYIWWKMPFTQVTCNGRASRESAVYRSWDGRFLVSVHDPLKYLDNYIIDLHNPYTMTSSVCNTDPDAFVILSGLAISKDNPVPCEAMPGLEELVNPDLVIRKTSIAFTTGEKVRVRASW